MEKNKMLVRLLMCSLVILVVVATVWPHAPGQNKRPRFDPDGSFWIHGEPPNEFSDFSGINLNAKRLRRLPSAGVQLSDGKTFRYKALVVKRESFTFTTVEIGGVSYGFSGRFLQGGVFASTALDEKPVLKGILTKYKSGKKIAEAELAFIYFGGT